MRVTDSGDLRKYRTEIPNIVYHLGLTPFELTLYNHLKRTAGANGQSRKSADTLAAETGMSKGMVSKAKLGLARPRAELSDQPLIVISPEKNKNGGKPKDLIQITDIWQENMAMFNNRLQGHGVTLQGHGVTVTRSPGDLGKEQREERTIKEKERTPLPPVVESKPERIPCPFDLLEIFPDLSEILPHPDLETHVKKWCHYQRSQPRNKLRTAEEWNQSFQYWMADKPVDGNGFSRGNDRQAEKPYDPWDLYRPKDDEPYYDVREKYNMLPEEMIRPRLPHPGPPRWKTDPESVRVREEWERRNLVEQTQSGDSL